MAIIVVNKYKHIPTKNDYYIGRGSVLGNPFTSIKDRKTKANFICETREESIKNFESYINEQIELKNRNVCQELNEIYTKAKDEDVYLVCFCKPKSCHGDIIKNIIEGKLKKRAKIKNRHEEKETKQIRSGEQSLEQHPRK